MSNTEQKTEISCTSLSGYAAMGIAVGLVVLGLVLLVVSGVLTIVALLAAMFFATGLYSLQPKEAMVITLFGKYVGTDRSEGLRWVNPFKSKQKISVRARNSTVPVIKVNDKRGNPIEISAAIVWKVRDTAKALFEVDSYERYVNIQAESGLRHLASQYAYDEEDKKDDDQQPVHVITLRASMDEVAATLKKELQERFAESGVEVVDAKLTHLAYAPEIAHVMLRRQQAEAIISARRKIVDGAVGMVELALKELKDRNIVDLDTDAERKISMVNNMLVVLCADKDVQPVANTASLYSS